MAGAGGNDASAVAGATAYLMMLGPGDLVSTVCGVLKTRPDGGAAWEQLCDAMRERERPPAGATYRVAPKMPPPGAAAGGRGGRVAVRQVPPPPARPVAAAAAAAGGGWGRGGAVPSLPARPAAATAPFSPRGERGAGARGQLTAITPSVDPPPQPKRAKTTGGKHIHFDAAGPGGQKGCAGEPVSPELLVCLGEGLRSAVETLGGGEYKLSRVWKVLRDSGMLDVDELTRTTRQKPKGLIQALPPGYVSCRDDPLSQAGLGHPPSLLIAPAAAAPPVPLPAGGEWGQPPAWGGAACPQDGVWEEELVSMQCGGCSALCDVPAGATEVICACGGVLPVPPSDAAGAT